MKCLCCGSSIRKWTVTVDVHRGERTQYQKDTDWHRHIYPAEMPRTIDDCRKLTNQTVVSVSREWGSDADYKRSPTGYIDQFREWNGTHYLPSHSFFCTNNCAMTFGKMAAEAGYRINGATKGNLP